MQDVDTLNPLYAQALSSVYTQSIWNCRPWNFDSQNNPLPVLVQELPSLENGGISQDGRVITLKLRDGVSPERQAALQELREAAKLALRRIGDPLAKKSTTDLLAAVQAEARAAATSLEQP